MKLSGLQVRVTQRERCPYCHDALGEVERVECRECGTPHHPACLEELGGCTVLGCRTAIYRPLPGSVAELQARVRGRVERVRSHGYGVSRESEERVRRRLARQPAFCSECFKELRVDACPRCKLPLLSTCEGDAQHCANPECSRLYDMLYETGRDIVDPAKDPWMLRYSNVLGHYVQNRLFLVAAPAVFAVSVLVWLAFFLGVLG